MTNTATDSYAPTPAMASADLVEDVTVTRFPAGWWVTVHAGPGILGEPIAFGLGDVDAYYLLYRIGGALNDGPVPLTRIRTVARTARRELRTGALDAGWPAWITAQVVAAQPTGLVAVPAR